MLRQLVDFGLFKLETEPLNAGIERRLKNSWNLVGVSLELVVDCLALGHS